MGSTQPVLKPKKGYWYKFYFAWCPICGRERKWKVRMYTPKPEDWTERYSYDNTDYDWCDI